MRRTEILILRAGLSGTLLASQLEAEGYPGEIVLLDSRIDFTQEQCWCSWAEPLPILAPLVRKSWKKWKIIDCDFLTTQVSAQKPYRQIYAPDFYDYFHSHWKSRKQIFLAFGERVCKIIEKSSAVEVLTDKGIWQAKIVFDARGSFRSSKNRVFIYQTFLGFSVEFKQSVFDTETVTLMDFRLKEPSELVSGVNFVYILPYSETEALIESTSFSPSPLSFNSHRYLLQEYIRENFGTSFVVKKEEKGILPMTTAMPQCKFGERIFRIGISGGAIRP